MCSLLTLSRKYQLTQHGCNFAAVLAYLSCVGFVPAEPLAEMLIALAVVNFFQGFIGTFVSEIFTSHYLQDGLSKLSFYLRICFFAAVIYAVMFYFLIEALGIEITSKYKNLVVLSLLLGCSFYLTRALCVLSGDLASLIICNIVDFSIYTFVIFSVYSNIDYLISYDLLLLKVPIGSLLLLFIKKACFNFSLSSTDIGKSIKTRLFDLALFINLLMKSFVSNLDILLVSVAAGKDVVPIYKLMQTMRTLLTSFSGAYWKTKVSTILGNGRINIKSLRMVIYKMLLISISISLLGSLCIFIGTEILLENPKLQESFATPIWLYHREFQLFLYLVAFSYAVSQWTRIALLVTKKIYLSTIVYGFVALTLAASSIFTNDLERFIIVLGCGTFLMITVYQTIVYNIILRN